MPITDATNQSSRAYICLRESEHANCTAVVTGFVVGAARVADSRLKWNSPNLRPPKSKTLKIWDTLAVYFQVGDIETST